MKPLSQINNRYRQILIASIISSGSLLPLLSALADQNSPTPGITVENQATAEFIDAADSSTQTALSDIVRVTIAEVAGISATGSATTGTPYRTNIVYFDFLVKNEGNDPTQLFVPGKPSSVTIGGVAIPAGNIGALSIIEYNNVTTTTSGLNIAVPAAGAATGSLTGFPTGSGGSLPAGGYIKVRVPITIPKTADMAAAVTGATISVTLGNTATQPTVAVPVTNQPYTANGVNGTGQDLYTQDNSGTSNGDYTDPPINGEREASAILSTQIVNPDPVTIAGTVWDDANGSAIVGGIPGFIGIQSGAELGAVIATTTPLYAILVDANGKVLDSQPVRNATTADAANPVGSYKLTALGVQDGVYVILSTTAGAAFVAPATATTPPTVGLAAPTPSVPTGWAETSPLTYTSFNIGITNTTGKDFGIELLPDTAPVSQSGIANPPGATKYQVPTLTGSDTDPTTPTTLGSGSTFKIATIPLAAQGILYYNTGTTAAPVYTPVTAGQTITNYDPTKLTFDPVDGVVAMSFTYASVDAAGKVDPTPATASMNFTATPVTFSGRVYNDRDGLTTGTSNNGPTISANPTAGTADVGTDSKFGTTQTAVNAVLVDANGVALQASVVVAADGSYSFSNVPPSTNVRVVLSATAVASGATPTATAPTGWVGTAPKTTATINTGLYPITSGTNDVDFGIRQKAKLVLLKRITKINGLTTNPNDSTKVLTGSMSSTDAFNGVGNWPTPYVVGSTNAGAVKPGDTIEYTIYFLNNQGSDATGVKICDPIRGAQDFQSGTISLTLGNGPATSLDDSYSYGGTIPLDCNASNATSSGAANGGVRIPLTVAVPGATGVGAPTTSYGKFSFTTKVKP